jgi:VWFA-related protein
MPRALLFLWGFCLLGQEPVLFRSDVALVRLDVEVRTATGSVAGLTRESFRVIDGARVRNVAYFAHDEQPLDMILLIDTSSSMRPSVARVAEEAHAALGGLRQGDRVALMAFDKSTQLMLDFTGDFAEAEQGIGERVLQRSFGGYTRLQSALADAARQFLNLPRENRRRAIVIVTDDEGTSPDRNAVRALWDADAVLLGVIVGKPVARVSVSHFEYYGMRNIAIRTGGDSIDTTDAVKGLDEMIRRLRQRYFFYYTPPSGNPGAEHTVRVELTPAAAALHPGAIVRARTGYFAP